MATRPAGLVSDMRVRQTGGAETPLSIAPGVVATLGGNV
jgi:hypothetical protein